MEQNVSADPLSLSFQAFKYLCCHDGNWDGTAGVIRGVTGYLESVTGISVTEQSLVTLKGILEQKPVDDDALWNWFDESYPEPDGDDEDT